MAKIKVKQLEIGMTLVKDVCDPNGRFLLGAGCEIEQKHIKALNAWGVISIEISEEDMPADKMVTTISPEIFSVIEAQVQHRFKHNDMESPFIKELATESVKFIIERLEE